MKNADKIPKMRETSFSLRGDICAEKRKENFINVNILFLQFLSKIFP